MFDSETGALLESGCSISVATVGPDGAPHASRGWGLTVLRDGARVRLLLDADDRTTLANLAGGGAIAVTCVAVPTMRAVQLKGKADEPVLTSDAADLARAARHCESFFADVNSIEGTPVALLERLRPTAFAVCTITVTEVYDQTPGPAAGSPLREGPMSDELDLRDLYLCFEGAVPAVIATANADGVPNITYLSRVRMVDGERVALSNQFFSKTARNLAENPRASVLVIDPCTFDQYRLRLVYERTERRGPTFERLRDDVDSRRGAVMACRTSSSPRRRHLPRREHRTNGARGAGPGGDHAARPGRTRPGDRGPGSPN